MTLLETGRRALARGEWKDAKRAFESALRQKESPEALEGLGLAAWWLDLADLVFESREHAYRLYRERGDRGSAARVAVWLAWDSVAFHGERAVSNGWLRRAHRLLESHPESAEHAWLALREGISQLIGDGNPDATLAHAELAMRIGQKIDSVDVEMLGQSLHGLALVAAGRVTEGMQELDEVNAAVLAGELSDPVAIGLACCYLLNACERVRDTERALQWCARLKKFCTSWGLRPLLAVCRTQYASACVWQGEWADAESELRIATNELEAARPAMIGEAYARLGELRRRQGKLADAAALFEKAGHQPIAQIGQIALALDRGQGKRAVDLAERYLRHVLPQNRMERAAGLEYLVRASVATESMKTASAAAQELRTIAREVATPSLVAAASFAEGLVAAAARDADSARRNFEDAVDLFEKCHAPYETAEARLSLAGVLEHQGDLAGARDEARRAYETFSSMHAGVAAARAEKLQERLAGRTAAGPATDDTGGLTKREVDVIRLIAAGLNNQRIAAKLFISDHTVHRHVANILTKLDTPSRSAAVAKAARMGLLEAIGRRP